MKQRFIERALEEIAENALPRRLSGLAQADQARSRMSESCEGGWLG